MTYLAYITIGLYAAALLVIFVYSLSQLGLTINYLKYRRKKKTNNLPVVKEFPLVTIQLPVYNEKYVMERLLHCVAALDYDKTLLQIQVLDDSTDESLQQTALLVQEMQQQNFDIELVYRENRDHYKAGALKNGLLTAKGEFIAIFDSDFLPGPQWIKQTLAGFTSPQTGVVQTRWSHVNEDYSLLTRVQAFALDAHFTLEQTGRNAKGHFINFNGTAGMWRKACIIDAGNWSGDTLTEDLDLSYRAQLRGWEFTYLENVVAPAELPVAISAARSQQFRWNKGGAENLLKMLPKVLKSKSISFSTKLHAIFHLGNSSMFFFVLMVSLLSIPVMFIKNIYPQWEAIYNIHAFFIVSTLILFLCHWVAYRSLHGNSLAKFLNYIKMFVSFFTLALGFSLHNSLAVAEAFRGRKSAFIRTPKFGVVQQSDSWKGNQYVVTKLSPQLLIEIGLLCYFIFGFFSCFYLRDFTMLPFQSMLCVGFGYVVFTSLKRES